MQARRRLLMQEAKPKWDYELFPEDGTQAGFIACKYIQVNAGDQITVNYYAPDRGVGLTGYVYDARLIGSGYHGRVRGGAYPAVYDEDTTVTFTAAKSGRLVIADHNTAGQDGVNRKNDDTFYGKYIRVRIN